VRLPRLKKQEPPKPAQAKPASTAAASIGSAGDRELRAERDRLLERFTIMQSDLGGAFYEMAIRDHVRLDVLTRKAAELQRVDAELLAVERQLELERSDAAGLCEACGSPYGAADRFCPQCGTPLTPVAGNGAAAA
jgi:hypothetical protein